MEILFGIGLFCVFFMFIAISWGKAQEENTKSLLSTKADEEYNFLTAQGVRSGIAINPKTKEIVFKTHDDKICLFKFNSILSANIKINDNTVSVTNRGSQIAGVVVGGLVLGPVGMLLGGLTSSKNQKVMINKLSIIIGTNELENTLIELKIYDGSPVDNNTVLFRTYSDLADKWLAKLNAIIQSNLNIQDFPDQGKVISSSDETFKVEENSVLELDKKSVIGNITRPFTLFWLRKQYHFHKKDISETYKEIKKIYPDENFSEDELKEVVNKIA